MTTGIPNWDNEEELDGYLKGEEMYSTKEGRILASSLIVKKYMEIKGIKINPNLVKEPIDVLIDIVTNDKAFRDWAMNNYRVYIEYMENIERFYILKITDEMLELINKSPDKDLNSKQLIGELKCMQDRLYHPEKY